MSKTPPLNGAPRAFVNPRVPAETKPQQPATQPWEGKKLPWGVATNPVPGGFSKPSPAQKRVNDAVAKLSTTLGEIHNRETREGRLEDDIKSVSAGKDAKGNPAIVVTMKTNKLTADDREFGKGFVAAQGFGKLPVVVKAAETPRPAINPAPSSFHTIGGEPVKAPNAPNAGDIKALQDKLHDARKQIMKDLREGTAPKAEALKEQFGVDFPTHPALKGKTDFA